MDLGTADAAYGDAPADSEQLPMGTLLLIPNTILAKQPAQCFSFIMGRRAVRGHGPWPMAAPPTAT